MENYKGYKITYDQRLPVTGRWRAECYGVGMCANDKPMLFRMIDAKVAEKCAEVNGYKT